MLLLYALSMAQLVLFAVTTYVVARAVGGRVRAIMVGSPAVVRVRAANPEVRIGPFPSGSVDLVGLDDAKDRSLSRAARIAVALAPWGLVLGIAMACLGPGPALRTFARGFEQIVLTLDVTPLVAAMVEIARTAPVEITAGILFAKLALMNLLPFGGLAGGAVVRALVGPGRITDRYMVLTMIAWMLWTFVRFGWALIAVARS